MIVDLFTVNIRQSFNIIPEILTFYRPMALENLGGGGLAGPPSPGSNDPGFFMTLHKLRPTSEGDVELRPKLCSRQNNLGPTAVTFDL